MAEATYSRSSLQGMRPEVAKRRIESFRKRFGEAHLYLAQHAAFPLTLTPDLLYRLWANFQQDIHGEKLSIPWVAVADLLLSSLCEEVGYELYEMDVAVRDALLHDLKVNPNFGQVRIEQLADCLLVYVRQQLDSHDPDIRDIAKAQRWIALAYTVSGKSEVAHELAVALRSSLEQNDRAEQLRMASLIETFAEPLDGFTPLLAYARGVGYLARGDIEGAMAQFSDMTGREDSVQVLGMGLPIPQQVSKDSKDVQKQVLVPQVPTDSTITENTTISDDIRIGQQIGNYLIVKKLADGPSGSVYLGQDLHLTDRTVAIKLLETAYLDSKRKRERFLQEAQLLFKLEHPYILPLLDIGEYQDFPPFLVAAYASNGSLRDRINRQSPNPLPLQESINILIQVGQALQYVHQQNIIHCDLKPENILFNAKGDALLADIGISVILETTRTRDLGWIGTATYMAPEQFEGKVSKKSDQYALGCIAYELLTGQKPFVIPNPTIEALWFQHAKVDPVALTQLNPTLPIHIEKSILKAMAKDSKDRYADVSSFIAALYEFTKCPNCDAENRPGVNFCRKCGYRLFQSTSSPKHPQAAFVDATIADSEDWVSLGAEHSPPNQKSDNTQTGQLDPNTLLHKRYIILKVIGRGGMAAVYQANDTRRGTLVAIKEMSLSTVPTNERSQAIQNFLAEARILSRLNHPNLPAFTDFFTEGARHFLVMEYIDGNTLEELLDRNKGPFSEPRVLGWARQLCDVLEYLHNQQPPVIFRDMKPGDIMLTRSGRIKLIDFGIARLFRNRGSQDTQLLGTPGFAPPEQYGSAQTDERSDIYSLAMTLFQLLTCSISETGFGLTKVHTNFPHISPPVARALEKATSLRPEDRYESIVVFRRALLGVGAFQFENGDEATTPEELADLCAHYSTEAADYLYSGMIESWLSEIGEHDLARATKRIRAMVGDPEMGVNRFLQAVMGPNAQTRNYIPTSTAGNSSSGRTGTGTPTNTPGSRIGWPSRTRDSNQVVVRPKTIDFEEVYPGLSHPILLTISGVKGALVKGTIRPVESWIVLDQTAFDGMSTPVRVRADTTRLRGSTHYTGTIIISPDNNAEEISVKVEVDVLGFTTLSSQELSQSPKEAPEEPKESFLTRLRNTLRSPRKDSG